MKDPISEKCWDGVPEHVQLRVPMDREDRQGTEEAYAVAKKCKNVAEAGTQHY